MSLSTCTVRTISREGSTKPLSYRRPIRTPSRTYRHIVPTLVTYFMTRTDRISEWACNQATKECCAFKQVSLCAIIGAMSILSRLVLGPVIGSDFPYITFFPAVTVVAWLCGPAVATICILLAAAFVACFVNPSPHGFNWYGSTFFIFSAGLNVGIMQVIKHAILETRKLADLNNADRRKDEFLAMLAHELRNPLAPIQNAVSLLGRSTEADMIEYVRESIERNLNHMVRLVDDLLDVSRIMRGKIELRKEPVEVWTIVERAIEQTRPLLDSRNHSLSLSVPEEPIVIDADPVRISQVIANLLNNAAKYTEDGGEIALKVEMNGDSTVRISVEDNGIGIPAELLPNVFEPFIQADQALDRSQGGLGIGLALVWSLIQMHDGTVTATSKIGQGSKFMLRLPARSQPIRIDAPSTNGDAGAHQAPIRILVVDDNEDSARGLGMLLQFDGHSIALAYTGDEAIEAADDCRPDVILLDIGLPGKSGYEVATFLRSQPQFKDTYLIAMTGYGREEDKLKANQCGFDKHLTKPVKYEQVRDLLIEYHAARA